MLRLKWVLAAVAIVVVLAGCQASVSTPRLFGDVSEASLTVNDYAAQGIVGVTVENVSTVNTILAGRGAAGQSSKEAVQAVVDSVNALQGRTTGGSALTSVNTVNLGIPEVNSAPKLGLLNDVLEKNLAVSDVDTYRKIRLVGVTVDAVVTSAESDAPSGNLTVDGLGALKVGGVTATNIADVRDAIADATVEQVSTAAGLQSVVDTLTEADESSDSGDDSGSNVPGDDSGPSDPAPTGDPMILVVSVSDGALRVTLPLWVGHSITVDWGVDNWGDAQPCGQPSNGVGSMPAPVDCDFPAPGQYTITIKPNLLMNPTGPWMTRFGGDDFRSFLNADKLVEVVSFGTLGLEDLTSAFNGAVNLTKVPDSLPSTVTSLKYMFKGATSFNQNLNDWDVINVTDFTSMFEAASAFNNGCDLEVDAEECELTWDLTDKTVVDMFKGSGYAAAPGEDSGDGSGDGSGGGSGDGSGGGSGDEVVNFDPEDMVLKFVASVTAGATVRVELPIDLTTAKVLIDWGADAPDSCGAASKGCDLPTGKTHIVSISRDPLDSNGPWLSRFGNELAGWEGGAIYLTEVLSFGELSLTNLRRAFHSATTLTKVPDELPAGVENLSWAFQNAMVFNQDISGWDTSSVTTMEGLFFGANAFNQDLSAWNVTKIGTLPDFFGGADGWTGLPFWGLPGVAPGSMILRFDNTQANRDVKLRLLGTRDVKFFWYGFANSVDGNKASCPANFGDTGTIGDVVTCTGEGASDTYPVKTVIISPGSDEGQGPWLTEFGWGNGLIAGLAGEDRLLEVVSFGNLGLTSLSGAFRNATNLANVPSQLPSTVTDTSFMFAGATAFNQNIGSWNTSNVTNMAHMFNGASAFNQDLSGWCVASFTSGPPPFFANGAPLEIIAPGAPSKLPLWGLSCEETPIDELAITGVTVPAAGDSPVSAITNLTQYTGTVAWSPSDATFVAGTVYEATITLTPKPRRLLTGVTGFTVASATDVIHTAGSNVIKAVFPVVPTPPFDLSWRVAGGTDGVDFRRVATDGAGNWVALPRTGQSAYISQDNGLTWTAIGAFIGSGWKGVAFGGSETNPMWLLVGDNGVVGEGAFSNDGGFIISDQSSLASNHNLRAAARGVVSGVDTWIVAGDVADVTDSGIRMAAAAPLSVATWRPVVTLGFKGFGAWKSHNAPGTVETIAIENGTVLIGGENGIWRLADDEVDTLYRVTPFGQDMDRILGIVSVANPGTVNGVWLASSRAGMLRSTDDGKTWGPVTPDPFNSAINDVDSRKIRFAFGAGVVTAVPAYEFANAGTQNRTLRSAELGAGGTWRYLTEGGDEVALSTPFEPGVQHGSNRRDVAYGDGRWVVVTTSGALISDQAP